MAWGPTDSTTRALKTLPMIPAGLGHLHIPATVATATPCPSHFTEGCTPTLNVTWAEYTELLNRICKAEQQSNLAVTNF